MGNSSRDPYWQASVRRESIDHPESQPDIEDECSVCHMPIPRYKAKLRGERGRIFAHLPFSADKKEGAEAEDGVTCSVCHQIGQEKLGTPESYNGGFVIDPSRGKNDHPEYGPFEIEAGLKRIMQTSTGGFMQTESPHIRSAEMCATCHTLITKALGPGGKVIGKLDEQMPYPEWLHSSYKDKQTCQDCHMPLVDEMTPITRVLGVPRAGFHQHVFVGANFFMQRLLNRYRDELSVRALPPELTGAADGTVEFLKARAARISIEKVDVAAGHLSAQVFVENLTGHKLPTAYPARRAWLHVVVRDANGRAVFESGAWNADGSITGNDNDADATRFEPHYSEITRPDQVQIYEAILKNTDDHVTTGLLSAVGYLKDNRLLPHGFDKRTADESIGVYGEAAADPQFTDAGDRVRYVIALNGAPPPYEVTAELWYEPIGFRWANNLKPYDSAFEDRRFNGYYDSMRPATAVVLARTTARK